MNGNGIEQASDDAESLGDSVADTHSRSSMPFGVGLVAQEKQRAVQHEAAKRFRLEIAQHFDLETDQGPDRMVRRCLAEGSVAAYCNRVLLETWLHKVEPKALAQRAAALVAETKTL